MSTDIPHNAISSLLKLKLTRFVIPSPGYPFLRTDRRYRRKNVKKLWELDGRHIYQYRTRQDRRELEDLYY